MRIVFMGTDPIALPSFQRLLSGADVAGLVTQPDRPVGRKQLCTPPALKVLAEEAGIPVFQPESLRDEGALETIAAWNPDLIVVMAYGQILPDSVINLAPKGCINAHASLLPRHRGASCVSAAIRAGDAETGITIMHVVRKLDSGNIIKKAGFPLMGLETGGMLHQALADFAPNVLMDAISMIESGQGGGIPQDDPLATYAPKLTRKDGLIDWAADCGVIERNIRAMDPWPGTYTYLRDRKGRVRKLKIYPFGHCRSESGDTPGEILEVTDKGMLVACGCGSIAIVTLQPEGGRKMTVQEFAAGKGIAAGMVFETSEP